MVREFWVDNGWGVTDGAAVPGGCWVHFSAVAGERFRELSAGQAVWFRAEVAAQDGFGFRAVKVWSGDVEPGGVPSSSGDAYRSTLRLTFDEPGSD
ncbi:cold shock domain-containing protein [Actinoplanes sp. NPDC026619]|uniref:cold shock domain-containing protein n=1 Tax=Actinoplanes sp. NPDC026619 TaxID=3155798 RepID=UPI0033CCE948